MPELVRTGAGGRGSTVEEVGYRLTGELLDLAGPPTALFTGSNLLTMGAVRAVYERNLRIPEEVALAGFDEVDWTPATGSGLTVVAQPTYELGRTAAELLLRRIEDGTRPFQEVTLKPTVRIRGSCARHAPEGQVRNKTTNGGSATRT
jgi:DNA-binding LacI/PurR family transcriptional regulator